MASDRQQYDRMQTHYDALLADNALSVAPEVGRLAIVTMFPEEHEAQRPEDTFKAMDAEARRLQNIQQAAGKTTIYASGATVDTFWDILDDETISDITLIGLGQLGKVGLTPWQRETVDPNNPTVPQPALGYFDAISQNGRQPTITHLKQGNFHQRTSGRMPASLNIPFAWGFMADRAKIWGVPQRGFYPNEHDAHPVDGLSNIAEHFELSPQDITDSMSYEAAKALFGKREVIGREPPRYPVPDVLLPFYNKLRDNNRIHGAHSVVRNKLRAVRGATHSDGRNKPITGTDGSS